MRPLPAGLQAHLDSGTTTLCHCWRLTLASGEKLGFTDHDLPLVFDGTTFEAQAGFTGSEIETSLGLSVDNLEANGALQSGRLDEARLRAGDFDHAAIEIWLVNWSNTAQRLRLRTGHLGEVTTSNGMFSAEVRGLAHLLGQPKGRIYQHGCDAALGDSRCGKNLATSAFRATATVTAWDGTIVTLSGLGFADAWASHGTMRWLSGQGAGRSHAIKRHWREGSNHKVSFSIGPGFVVTPGDEVEVTVGCDKSFATCGAKFANAANFRGFPHMPGNDFVMGVPHAGDPALDGGRRG